MLSDSEADSDKDFQLTINEHYANAYAKKKEREELSKLKEKYGSDFEAISGSDEEDSEDSDVTEDEDGEELTPAMDAAILRTLARIKRKDPEIYDSDKHIFEEERNSVKQPSSFVKQKTKEAKPITIKQQALSSILNANSRSPSPQPLTYEQEQRALRAEVISAFHGAVNQSGSNEEEDKDDLFIPREKGKDEIEYEEEEYREFLAREVGEDIRDLIGLDSKPEGSEKDTTKIDKKAKKEKKRPPEENSKANSNRAADEEFLMNYILNRGWVDRDAKRIPTYKEITHKEQAIEEENVQEDDEEFEEIADNFESSYNFRFEEPDGATIATFPRNLSTTVRRQDTRRKEARERRKQRHEEEMNKKREEIKRLKALKAKELREKLEKIEKEGGVELDSEVLANFDLDGEWDPQKHDEQMAMMYEGDEGQQKDEKPHWDYDIDVDDVLPTKAHDSLSTPNTKKKGKRKMAEEEDMDDAVGMHEDTMDVPEEWDGTEEMRKKKVQEYLDEVYGMEFNDIVGDIPTRFSYTQVASQNYDLTADEILLATDAELNQYMGLKKLASYRKDRRNYDPKRMARLKEFKTNLQSRKRDTGSGVTDGVNENGERPSKKRKGKKERQRAKKEQSEATTS